ncbi:MAG: F0F1 ATP synthase subunit A [Candidatus Desulforudis sp.]|nr:F0F1 ATP synthase subunit A [Desulforudis sp.]
MAAEHGHEGNFLEVVHHDLNIYHLPKHWDLGEFMGYPIQLNADTIFFTWVAMAVCLLLGWVAVRGANIRRPTKMQCLFEMLLGFLGDLIKQSMDPKKGAGLFSIVVTFFLFLSVMNVMGVVPTYVKPTADIQTTFAFALITMTLIYAWGIKYKGAKMFKHYITPIPILAIIEDIAKGITLAFRLFGNMKGKEIMILALLGLITGWGWLAGGFLASTIWLLFCIFISLIQAFVFTMLTIAFVGSAVGDDH